MIPPYDLACDRPCNYYRAVKAEGDGVFRLMEAEPGDFDVISGRYVGPGPQDPGP